MDKSASVPCTDAGLSVVQMAFVHSKVGNFSVDITKASAETEFAVRSEAETTFADTKRKQSKVPKGIGCTLCCA